MARGNNRPLSNRRRGRHSLEQLESRSMLDGEGTGGGGTPLLPDLIPWADEARGYVHDWAVDAVSGGRTLLRLSTATANIGVGPLELVGSTTHPDGTQDVLQRVYQSDGEHVDRLAGQFEFHPEHDHVHFADYAAYNLRAVTEGNGIGDIVATGGKTSFCLLDLEEYKLTLPGAPDQSQYIGCDTTQGLSVGWADVYDRELPDQWIDVTGVPLGPHWLEVVVDPENRIEELNDGNNVTRILIDLTAPRPLTADAYEPNNTRGKAADLGSGPLQLEQLTIHAPDNADWYAWTATDSGPLDVIAHFDHSEGDVDLFVFDASGELLASSEDTENVEQVTLNLLAGAKIYIQVIGYDGAINSDYSLSIDAEDAFILPDALEPNDSFAAVTHLPPTAQTIFDLSVHSAADEDFFRWTSPIDGHLTVQALFDKTQGDADLYVYNMLHQLIGSSTGATGLEEVPVDVPHGALLYIRVVGFDDRLCPSYTLVVNIEPHLPGDVNHSGAVDLVDLNLVRNHFGESGEHAQGDSDLDGDVDLADLNAVRNHFGESLPTSPIAAPMAAATRPPERKNALATDLRARIALLPSRRREIGRAREFAFAAWID